MTLQVSHDCRNRNVTPAEREFHEMVLSLARTVRRGRSTPAGLARVAAEWEERLQRELDQSASRLELMAAEPPPSYGQAANDEG